MLIDQLLPLALACIMFSLGLALSVDDFRRVFEQRRSLLIGLAAQLLLVPLSGALLVAGLGLPASLAVGLMLLAACPGGASSGFLTHLARGNTALSLLLTVLSSLLALLTFPILANLTLRLLAPAADAETVLSAGQLPVGKLLGSVLLVTTLPILAGMLVRYRWPARAARYEPAVSKLATLFFVAIVLGTFFAYQTTIVANLATVGPAALLLNALVMLGGGGLALGLGCSKRDAVAIAMESGLQNAGLAIFVALVLLRQPELAVAPVVYAVAMNIGALLLVGIARLKPRAVCRSC